MKKESRLIDPPDEKTKIKLNSFSESDRSHITDKDYLTAIKKGNMGIPYIIEKIYFNKDKPENHNICMTNVKSGFVKVYNKLNGWEQELANEIVNFLVEDNANIIEDKISEWRKVDSDSDEEEEKELLPNQKTKHQIMGDNDLEDTNANPDLKLRKKPKHKYGADKYKNTLDKFPRLLDRISNSNYVRKTVFDKVRLILYNKRQYAMNIEKNMKKLLKF